MRLFRLWLWARRIRRVRILVERANAAADAGKNDEARRLVAKAREGVAGSLVAQR